MVLLVATTCQLRAQTPHQSKEWVVRDIIITGNERTQPYVFDRFLDFDTGHVVQLSELLPLLDRNRKHLLRTALFNDVTLTVTRMVKDSLDVEVKVSERWYYFIYPYFELSDRNFNEWWTTFNRDIDRTIIGATFYINNIRGRDERLKLMALFGFNQELGLRFTQPFIRPGADWGWEVEGYLWRTRNVPYATQNNRLQYLRTSAFGLTQWYGAFRWLYQPNAYWKIAAGLQYAGREIIDTVAALNPDYLPAALRSIEHVDLTLDMRWDNTDHIAYPLRGQRFRLRAQRMGIGIWDDLSTWRVAVEAAWYEALSRRWFAEVRGFAGMTAGQSRPYFLQRALGYENRLVRGHELDVVDGQRYGLVQTSLKWQLFDIQLSNPWMPIQQFSRIPIALYLRPHFDVGYAADRWHTEANPLHNTLLLGGGIGLDLVTYYDYALSVNFSINRQGEKGLYLHVNF